MQPATSDTMRKLMRLVVTDGFGKQAEVAGYYPGGKTGTAEKVGKHGYKRGFKENFNVAAFTSVFPMNAPRYAVYMMVDEPHGNKSTYGYSTAGWVAAPAAGRVIARIAPMLGMLPDIQDAPPINQALFIPLQPGRPAGVASRVDRRPPVAAGRGIAPAGADRARNAAGAGASDGARPRHEARGAAPRCRRRLPARTAPLRLADIMRRLPSGSADASWRTLDSLPASPPTAVAWRPAICSPRLPGSRVDGRALHRRRRVAWRRRGAGAGGDSVAARRAAAAVAARTPSRAAASLSLPRRLPAASRASWSRSPAPTARPARSSSCGRSGPRRQAGRQPGHAGPDRAGLRSGSRPDHARSGQPGRDPGAAWRAPASSTRRWRPRRMASTSSAWTACGWPPRRSPT